MKNKWFFGMMVLAANMLTGSSCSRQDEVGDCLREAVSVQFTVNLPGAQVPDGKQRKAAAMSDGNMVDKLACEVYLVEANGALTKQEDLTETVPVNGGAATFSPTLLKGTTYRLVFFAHKEGAYDVSDLRHIRRRDLTTGTVVSTTVPGNEERYDAFCAYWEGTPSEAPYFAVTLHRPFAQLNIGTKQSDWEAALASGLDSGLKTEVKVTNVFTEFNAVADEVSGNPVELTFSLAETPTDVLTVDGTDYKRLSMNYLWVGNKGEEKSLTTVTMHLDDARWKDVVCTNVPVQRNYRTNLLSDNLLCTTPTFYVVVDAAFETQDYPFHLFSISDTKRAWFAPGNLQCTITGTDTTWGFAAQQYEILGTANASGTALAATIDLFGWSGDTSTDTQWGVSTSTDRYAYSGAFLDWGMKVGGRTWSTLSIEEWDYIVSERTNTANLLGVARIRLNEAGTEYVNGLILLPDDWESPEGVAFNAGMAAGLSIEAYATVNNLTLAQWETMEENGAVFLPAAGMREGTTIKNVQLSCSYWSSTTYGSASAYDILFSSSSVITNAASQRHFGRAVRPVVRL